MSGAASTAMLRALGQRRGDRPAAGITSVCSAHPLVIEAALLEARDGGAVALIEATCNQVNQEGGYTGMTPRDFRAAVHRIADRVGVAHDRIILGGDHLGPNPWRDRPPEEAMTRAGDMIEAYAAAGFAKLHLDCSMGCAGEAAAVGDEAAAARAAVLAARAEAATEGATTGRATTGGAPVYVIGTEVPIPGGALEALDHLHPTAPDAVRHTHAIHREAFRSLGEDAWSRVIAIVVQPGVEFGQDSVAVYAPEAARALVAARAAMPGLVYEAHSTDYQPDAALRALVEDGFAILKVGPALTFALREALYGLDAIAAVLKPGRVPLHDAMEAVMLRHPAHWARHVSGTASEQAVLRHWGYSDRIRYYWPEPDAVAAVASLLAALDGVLIAAPLVSQFLPRLYPAVASGALRATAPALLLAAIRLVLATYGRACGGPAAAGDLP